MMVDKMALDCLDLNATSIFISLGEFREAPSVLSFNRLQGKRLHITVSMCSAPLFGALRAAPAVPTLFFGWVRRACHMPRFARHVTYLRHVIGHCAGVFSVV
jgi:hypothetical protein